MKKNPVKVVIKLKGGLVIGVSTSIKEFVDIEIVDYDDIGERTPQECEEIETRIQSMTRQY